MDKLKKLSLSELSRRMFRIYPFQRYMSFVKLVLATLFLLDWIVCKYLTLPNIVIYIVISQKMNTQNKDCASNKMTSIKY